MARLPKMPKRERAMVEIPEGTEFLYGIGLRTEKLIGRFVVAWSRAEALMGDVIWVLLDVKMEDGRVITARMSAEMKLNWLKTFGERYAPDSTVVSLGRTLNCIEMLLSERNFIVHGSWGRLSSGEVVAGSLRPKTDPNKVVTEFYDDDRLENLISLAVDVRDLLVVWRRLLEAQPGRKTPPLYSENETP